MTFGSGHTHPGGFGIAEIARRHDVSLRTLRFYEQQGLIRPRRQGHDRFYSARDVTRLEIILKGKRFGFTLQEIGRLIGYEDTRERMGGFSPDYEDFFDVLDRETIARQMAELQRRKTEIDLAIAELKAMLAESVASSDRLAGTGGPAVTGADRPSGRSAASLA